MLNEAACNLPGFVAANQRLACQPWLSPAAAAEPVAHASQQLAPAYWLAVAVPTAPGKDGDGATPLLETTLTSLLSQVPLDPTGKTRS